MGYLGNTPGESFISFAKQVFTIVNSQTAYTLDFAVVDENELRLVVNNVVQEPGSGKAYTASGTTLTLSAALTNGTDEMYCVFLGKARETVTVPTITKDKLNLISTSSSAGLEVKGDGTTDGTLQLNCSQNSHGIKLASPPHSAGQSYTLTFPQSISADTFLKTDGSGNLSFAAAGGTNTPAFRVHINSSPTIANATNTALVFDDEEFDVGSNYDTSNGRFTPTTSGKYFLYVKLKVALGTGIVYVEFRKNGSGVHSNYLSVGSRPSGDYGLQLSTIQSANGSGDYFDVNYYQNSGSGKTLHGGADSSFMGYKIIE